MQDVVTVGGEAEVGDGIGRLDRDKAGQSAGRGLPDADPVVARGRHGSAVRRDDDRAESPHVPHPARPDAGQHPRRQWHALGIEANGDHLQVFWEGKPIVDTRDATFADAGKVGMWTKADSVTHFDALTVTPLR